MCISILFEKKIPNTSTRNTQHNLRKRSYWKETGIKRWPCKISSKKRTRRSIIRNKRRKLKIEPKEYNRTPTITYVIISEHNICDHIRSLSYVADLKRDRTKKKADGKQMLQIWGQYISTKREFKNYNFTILTKNTIFLFGHKEIEGWEG